MKVTVNPASMHPQRAGLMADSKKMESTEGASNVALAVRWNIF